jgi:phosphatidylinositol alpha-1,6-mannosyltransferase
MRQVLLVSEIFPPAIGGSGALLDNVYSRLEDTEVTVLAEGDERLPPERRGRLTVHHVSMQAPDWGIVRPACLRRHLRVARAIRRLTPERGMVHCGRGLPEGLSARLARMGGGAPYLCWTHGEELGFASLSRELTWLMRRVLASAEAVIANSRNSQQLLVSAWGLDAAKVHVVHPGVDNARFHPGVDGGALRTRCAGPDDVILLSVGRLQRRKGHDTVLAALPHVRRAVPHVRYVIVGDGPERPALERLAREAGVADITRFVGSVSEEELPAWYRAADIFVLPNRAEGVDFEGFGMVFLEAAAAGLPVVGGRSGGVPETMLDGRTGRLVDGTSAAEVAAVLIELAGSSELRRSLGRAGRERAVAEFSWATAAGQVAALDDALRSRAAEGSGQLAGRY